MISDEYNFRISQVPDCTHYKYVTAYEGSVRERIFLGSEHLLRMVSNFLPGELTVAFRFLYDPKIVFSPQDRMRLTIHVGTTDALGRGVVDGIICHGPIADFYSIEPTESLLEDWSIFQNATEIIRLEEGITPSSPPGLDIRRMNVLIPEIYYCAHPFKPRTDNDFLMFEKTCSGLSERALLEIVVRPTSQEKELDAQYREIIKLMAVNSFRSDDYIIDAGQLDPFKNLYEENPAEITETKPKDPMADEFLRANREFHRILRRPQLEFNVRVWAEKQETAHLLASTAGECAFEEGTYRLLDYGRESRWFGEALEASREFSPFLGAQYREIWDRYEAQGLSRLAHMTSVEEFKGMFRLPVAGYSSLSCLWKSTDYHRKTQDRGGLLIGHAMGTADASKPVEPPDTPLTSYLDLSYEGPIPVTMPLDLLTKHMFVTGVPGSGKTTAAFNLLVQLFGNNIPFLVIEPGKSEYRHLKMLQGHRDPRISQLAKELRIYTPGKEAVSPFRFNPFMHPEGISTEEHIGQLLTCFEASVPLGGPLQALLAESLEEVYKRHGRRTAKEREDADFPTMTDLVNAARRIMEKKGYSGEVRSNLSAAIEVRLSSLTRLSMGRIFQCRKSHPSIVQLLEHPTILEIQNLNPYQSCLLILFVLSAIWEEIRLGRRSGAGLKHVTVIEEAHNIVGRTDRAQPSEDFADPKAYAAEYIVRMLAEIRALGEGIVIADQLPSAVASSVVKNTGTKLAHRLVSLDDRQDLGGAMLLQGPQFEEIARLEPGQAYYYTEGLYVPRQIKGLNAHRLLGLTNRQPPDNRTLSSILDNESWFEEAKRERYGYLLELLSENYRCVVAAVDKAAGHLKIYREDFDQIARDMDKGASFSKTKSLHSDVAMSKEALEAACVDFTDCVRSIPRDIREHLDPDRLSTYKKLKAAATDLMTSRAPRLEADLESLRAEITNIL